MPKRDIVGLLVIETSGTASLGGAACSISDLLLKIHDMLMHHAMESLADGGVLRFQVFELETGSVLFELLQVIFGGNLK